MRQRLQYFDMLKGMAILLVVMGHVITFGVREIDRAFIFKVIGCVHMPLFFFISGWFSCSIDADTQKLKAPSLLKRFLQLIVPLAVLPQLWALYLPHSGLESPLYGGIAGLWQSDMKWGYWFTLCLFEISLLFAAIFPLLKRTRSYLADMAVTGGTWIVLLAIYNFVGRSEVSNVVGLFNFAIYWMPFAIGFIAAKYRDVFFKITESQTFLTVCLFLLAPTLYFNCYTWEFDWLPFLNAWCALNNTVFHICLAIVAIAIVKPWALKAYSPEASDITRRIANFWCLLGRKSLTIYLLHYFFLFPMGIVRPILESFNVAFVPVGVLALIVALCIIAAVLLVDSFISKSKFLALLLTGAVPTKGK